MKKIKAVISSIIFIFIVIFTVSCASNNDDIEQSGGNQQHYHSFSEDVKSDSTGHWYECECGEKKDFQEHDIKGYEIVEECYDYSLKNGECLFCHYITTIKHFHEYKNEITYPTCTEHGHKKFYCDCGYYYSDRSVEPIRHEYVEGECINCKNKPNVEFEYVNLNNDSVKLIIKETYEEDDLILPKSYSNKIISKIETQDYSTCISNLYYEGTIEDWCKLDFSAYNIVKYSISHLYMLNEIGEWYEVKELDASILNQNNINNFNVFSGIESVKLPNEIETIPANAFSKCYGIKNIIIPKTINTIEKYAFNEKLENVYYEGTIEDWCNIKFEWEHSNPMSCANHFYMLDENNEWYEPKELIIPNTIDEIGDRQFEGFKGIKIELPETITSIGEYAFTNCINIKHFEMPDKVTTIKDSCFVGCHKMETLKLSKSIETIGRDLFSYSENNALKNVYYGGTIKNWCEITFEEESNPMSWTEKFYILNNNSWVEIEDLIIPDTVDVIKENAFRGLGSLKNVYLPYSIESIGDFAFSNCTNLETINLPSHLKSIGDSAFNYCINLKNISIPNSVVSIGKEAFRWCETLEEITISSGIEVIKESTFVGCGNLRNVTLPNSLTTIEEFAFSLCDNLNSIIIPKTVTSIGGSAFSECNKLKEVYNLSNIEILPPKIIDKTAIYQAQALYNLVAVHKSLEEETHIIEKDGYKYVYDDNDNYYLFDYVGEENDLILPNDINGHNYLISPYTFKNNTTIKSVVLPNYITRIERDSFRNCINLESITLGEELLTIEGDAFFNCYNLTSIVIPKNVNLIGDEAFRFCVKLKEVHNLSSLNIVKGNYDNGYIGRYASIIDNSLSDSKIEVNGDFIFSYEEDYALLKYTGNSNEIVLPDDIKGFPYKISDYAFYNSPMISITIPKNIISIGEEAFAECRNLENVYFKGTLEDWCNIKYIESTPMYYASHFYMKNEQNEWDEVKEITIPSSITKIGSVFKYFRNVEKVTIHKNVNSIASHAFSFCENLKTVIIECDSLLGDFGESIFSSCFKIEYMKIPMSYNQKLGDYFRYGSYSNTAVPKSLTTVELVNAKDLSSECFVGCESIINLILPNTISKIRSESFYNMSSLENVYFKGAMDEWCNIYFGHEYSQPMTYASHFYVLNEQQEWVEMTKLEINSFVIFNNQFYGFDNITDVVLSDNVNNIEQNAFADCKKLENVYYKGTIEKWCNIFFENEKSNPMYYASHFYMQNEQNEWYEVTQINIPNDVKKIGRYQFYGFENVEDIYISNQLNNIELYGLFDLHKLENVYYEGSIEQWCGITFDNHYSNPMTYASHFYMQNEQNEWYEVTQINIPETVTIVGKYQFYSFENLEVISFNDKLENIDYAAFANCSKIKKIEIPDTVTSIGKYAFYGCNELTNVKLSNKVEVISEKVFYDCYALNMIILPKSINKIEKFAFDRHLYYIYYSGTSTEWIEIDKKDIANASIYYYSENKPTTTGSYWHYDSNGNAVKW